MKKKKKNKSWISLIKLAALWGVVGSVAMTTAAACHPSDEGHESPIDGGVAPMDSAVSPDATADSASTPPLTDGGPLQAPRPIAPLSTATTTSMRPTFRWELGVPGTGAYVDICKDRTCAAIEQSFIALGDHGSPPNDLAPGLHFWRLRTISENAVGSLTSPVWEVVTPRKNAAKNIDSSWGSTPDIDGDGLADVLIGAYYTNQIDVFRGRTSLGPAETPSSSFQPVLPEGGLGDNLFEVRTADLDGDGFVDVIAGYACIFDDCPPPGGGHVLIFRGGPGALATNAPPDIVIDHPVVSDGGFEGTRFGRTICPVGDFDGDGYGDLVIGAYAEGGAKGASTLEGHAWLYRGGKNATTAAKPLESLGVGPAGSRWGQCAAAGDVNGDGLADFIVMGNPFPSHVYLFLGRSKDAAPSATPIPHSVEIIVPPESTARGFGLPNRSPGDLNGDGYADMVFGDWTAATTGAGEPLGRIYVFAGDSDQTKLGVLSATLKGQHKSGAYGLVLSLSGDVNGDGVDDLFTTAPLAPNGGLGYLVTGQVNVFGVGPGVAIPPPTLIPVGGDDSFGGSLSAVGDVDGDGYPDLAVSDGRISTNSSPHVHVLYGNVGSSPTPLSRSTQLVHPGAWLLDPPIASR